MTKMSEKFNNQLIEKILNQISEHGEYKCPVCGSDDLETDTADCLNERWEVKCNNCNSEWSLITEVIDGFMGKVNKKFLKNSKNVKSSKN